MLSISAMAQLSPSISLHRCPLHSPPFDMKPCFKNAWSEIVRGHGHAYGDAETAFQKSGDALSPHTERQHPQAELCWRQQTELGDGDGETDSQKRCEPLCAEERKQALQEEEFRLPQKQHGDGEGNTASQKPADQLCAEKEGEVEEWRKREYNGDGYGDGESAAQKGKLSAQPEEWKNQQKREVELLSVEADIIPATVAEPERKKHVSNAIAESPQAVNGLLDYASAFSGENKEEESTAVPPKPAFRKFEAEARVFLESEFVMEASSWPTLAEARDTKPSEARKLACSQEAASILSPARKVSASQGSSTETLKHSSADVNINSSSSRGKFKSAYKRGSMTGNGKLTFLASENIPLPPKWHHVPGGNLLLPDQAMKRNVIMGMKGSPEALQQASGHGPFHYHGMDRIAPISNTSANWGHPGWHHHGRGYGNDNNKHAGFLLPHEQHIDPRNVHPPAFTPFMNINRTYYNDPNFQKGNMYYMPVAAPNFNNNTTYFRPSGTPGGITLGPDTMTIRVMLQKQIEYYFSIENLCKDMYLRSRMDDEGFVPVSLIASFNRVQMLTSSPMMILEALWKSSVVEVKGDRIRRSHDWGRWLLPKPSSSSQASCIESVNSFVPTKLPKPSSSSQASCIESVNSFVPTNHTRPDIVKEDQGNHILEESGEHSFDRSIMLVEIRLDAGTCPAPLTGATDGQPSGDTCPVHGIETKNRIDGDIPSVVSTGHMSSDTPREGRSCFGESRIYQNSSLNHGSFANGDGDVSLSRRFINAEGDPVCLSKSHSNREELNDRRFITVTHAQLSSCIAVP